MFEQLSNLAIQLQDEHIIESFCLAIHPLYGYGFTFYVAPFSLGFWVGKGIRLGLVDKENFAKNIKAVINRKASKGEFQLFVGSFVNCILISDILDVEDAS